MVDDEIVKAMNNPDVPADMRRMFQDMVDDELKEKQVDLVPVTVKRNSSTYLDIAIKGTYKNHTSYCVVISAEHGKMIELRTGMDVDEARSLAIMMKTLLAAQI